MSTLLKKVLFSTSACFLASSYVKVCDCLNFCQMPTKVGFVTCSLDQELVRDPSSFLCNMLVDWTFCVLVVPVV